MEMEFDNALRLLRQQVDETNAELLLSRPRKLHMSSIHNESTYPGDSPIARTECELPEP